MSCIRRAGDVQGTPGWQLDRMFETETARDLERYFNSDDDDFPAYRVTDGIGEADYHIGQAISILSRAADFADRYDRAKPLDKLLETLEEFRCEMGKVKEGFGGKQ